jgi:hypothetical protein
MGQAGPTPRRANSTASVGTRSYPTARPSQVAPVYLILRAKTAALPRSRSHLWRGAQWRETIDRLQLRLERGQQQ